VIVIGIDGGGLDDLLGLALVGRHRETGQWLTWTHAWAHKIVLERRKEIAPLLLDFKKQGDLTIVERPGDDVQEVADIICKVRDTGLLPDEKSIGVDAAGIGDIVDELTTEDRGITMEQIIAISQGYRLNGAIKTTERKVAGGEMVHGGRPMMAWCVGNARVEDKGNAILITKQASGKAKIDPLMAVFNAVSLMALNPAGQGKSFWEST
jgi:phage terminase large subunit-like protein